MTDEGRRPQRNTDDHPLEQIVSILSNRAGGRRLELTEDHIESLLTVRRALANTFGHDLFSDPAMEIFLQLFASQLAGQSVSLSALAAVTESPLSTTRRWIAACRARGLVSTQFVDEKRDEIVVTLTPGTARKLKSLGDQWASAFVSL